MPSKIHDKYQVTEYGRICTICNVSKPWDEFYQKKLGINGRDNACMPCRRAKQPAAPNTRLCVTCKQIRNLDEYPKPRARTCSLCVNARGDSNREKARHRLMIAYKRKFVQRAHLIEQLNALDAELDVMESSPDFDPNEKFPLSQPSSPVSSHSSNDSGSQEDDDRPIPQPTLDSPPLPQLQERVHHDQTQRLRQAPLPLFVHL